MQTTQPTLSPVGIAMCILLQVARLSLLFCANYLMGELAVHT